LTKSIRDLIDGLGDSTAQVAARLRKDGIKGVKGNSRDCVVKRWLATHGYPEAIVGMFEVQHLGTIYASSTALAGFVINYDEGKYPDMDESTEAESSWEESAHA
jgi:hypothetical protein